MTGQHRKPRRKHDVPVVLLALFGLAIAAVLFVVAGVLIWTA